MWTAIFWAVVLLMGYGLFSSRGNTENDPAKQNVVLDEILARFKADLD